MLRIHTRRFLKHVSNELMRDIIDMQINLGPHPVHESSDFVGLLNTMRTALAILAPIQISSVQLSKALTNMERQVNRSRTSSARDGWLAKPAALAWRPGSLANGRVDHLAWLNKHEPPTQEPQIGINIMS